MSACALFETPIGPCALVWTAVGIAGLQLPEGNSNATLTRAMRRFDATPSPLEAGPKAVVQRIQQLLHGEADDLASVLLDISGVPAFNQRVYELTRTIGPGLTITYGAIAMKLGGLHLARAVGQALGHNPFAIIVPCHRVVAAAGQPGGFTARDGLALKQRLLRIEGVQLITQPDLFA